MQQPTIATCLVIGGAGFVGSAITAAARQAGWEVAVATRANYHSLRGKSFDLVIQTSGNAKRFRAEREPSWDFEQSVAGIYRSLFDFPHRHYVLISSVDVYNDTTSTETTRESTPIDAAALAPYGFHKRLAELCVSQQAPSWQIFRLGQMVGPLLVKGPMFDVIHDKPLWVADSSEFPILDTRTVAATVLDLAQHAPRQQIYNICGRGSVSMERAARLWEPKASHWSDGKPRDRQVYRINVEKVDALHPLPESVSELSTFFTAERTTRDRPADPIDEGMDSGDPTPSRQRAHPEGAPH